MLPPLTGRRIGDFVIEDRIGRGGMASVYRARQLSVNRYVALKIIDLSTDQEEREEFRQRFAQEAAVIALLEHIHILPVYAYGITENEFAYLAMRLLRGGSLGDLLRAGPLPLSRTADIFVQVGRGLQYAHSKGVIHRDIKPSNILLDDAGNAYLSDFGLAKLIDNSLELTRSGNLVGTPAYVAPEQVEGKASDHRSDLYSLGILLYHMLVGHPPFELSDSGIAALLYKHVSEPPPPPRQLNPAIPTGVEDVVMRALAKDPNERYQSAEEMVHDFNEALGRKPGLRSFITLRTPDRLRRLHTRRRVVLRRGLIVLALLILLTLGAVVMISQKPPAPSHAVAIISGAHGTVSDVAPSDSEVAAAKARLGDKGFIAYLACSLDNVTRATMARELGDLAQTLGLAYQVYDAKNDAYTQLTQIEQARIDGAHAIILCPLDATLLTDAITSLKQANMPLVYTTLFDNPYGVKLDSDSYQIGLTVGRLGGQAFTQEGHSEARVVVLGSPGLPASDNRAEGMQAGFKEYAPNAQFVGVYAGATQDDAYAAIHKLIAAKTQFNAVLAITDAGAYGAIKALEEAGFDPNSVVIASANGESYAQQLIRQGEFLRGTVSVNTDESVQLAMDATVKLLAGSAVPETLAYPPGPVLTRQSLGSGGS